MFRSFMTTPQPSERWQDRLKLVSFCPRCQSRSRPVEARVVGEDGETHLLHVTCGKCRGAVLALVLINRVGASSVGMVTDLIFEDVLRFEQAAAIQLDEVIVAHQQLASAAFWQKLLPSRVGTRRPKSARGA